MAPAPLVERNGTPDEIDTFKPPPGIILPPKDMRKLVETTSGYIARNGPRFEAKVRETAPGAKTQFLEPDNPYYAYYRWRLEEIKAGRGSNLSAGTVEKTSKTKAGPQAPPDFRFSARMPTISAIDLEVVKLTAFFAAQKGRSWVTALSQRESGNYQFDFLRSQHSFYQFFSRLVDQYTEILNGDSGEGGRLHQEKIQELERNVQDKFQILDRAKKRAEWVKHQEAEKGKKEAQEEEEKIAYAQIDWHDFVVATTIVFTESDNHDAMPPPTSLNDLQSASLEQKDAMSMAPSSMRIEEAIPGQDYTNQAPSQQPTPVYQAANLPPRPYAASPQPTHSPAAASPYAPPPFAGQDEDFSRVAELQAERQRAEQARAAANTPENMRIRTDYVPRAQARRQAGQMTVCPNCKQQIPSHEFEQHMRIELLDPRWREQARIAQQRSSTTNLSTADVANNLKRLASQRSDVFDPVTGQSLSEEEAQRRKRVELGSYDGQAAAQVPPGTQQPSTDVQEQIRQLHQRYGGQ